MKKDVKDVVDLKNHLDQFDWREDEYSSTLGDSKKVFDFIYCTKSDIFTKGEMCTKIALHILRTHSWFTLHFM